MTLTTVITPPITASEARGNSRPVTAGEFQRLALEGRDRLRAVQSADWSTNGLDANWDEIKRTVYAEVQKPWGGATIDPRTGRELPQGADLYALSTKPDGMDTTSVGEHATRAEFDEAMDIARGKYGRELARGGAYLGIFHDDDNARIDIDPVTIVATPDDVESIGAYTHAIGGAYHFATGNGYFPPHVTAPEEAGG
jgi:hypothetical protein